MRRIRGVTKRSQAERAVAILNDRHMRNLRWLSEYIKLLVYLNKDKITYDGRTLTFSFEARHGTTMMVLLDQLNIGIASRFFPFVAGQIRG